MLVISNKVKYEYIDPQDEDWFHDVVWETYSSLVWQREAKNIDIRVIGFEECDNYINFEDRLASIYILGDEDAHERLHDDEREEYLDKVDDYIFMVDVETALKNMHIFHETRGFLIHKPVQPVW